MKIYIGADHRGFDLKSDLIEYLTTQGYEVEDCGAYEYNKPDDYPDFVIATAQKVVADPNSLGIVMCGSGTGATIAANKVKGARAIFANSAVLAKAGRADDDANILALPAEHFDLQKDAEVLQAWLTTPFSGAERHIRRRDKISAHENARAN